MDQYKSDLKANTEARKDLNVLRMLESRIIEIVKIENEVKKKYPKLFTQRLPRYMRRRAASHNPHRIPKWLLMSSGSAAKLTARDRSKLYHVRHKMRLKKHKRIVRRHRGHEYKNLDKPIFHKWFAKRFKMIKDQPEMEHVPLHNNTKNFRNLYRQTLYACAYLSLAHLVEIRVSAPYTTATINKLNRLTKSTAGFTFAARSLELGHYELLIHLYTRETVITTETTTETTSHQQTYLCPAFVSHHPGANLFSLWVSRDKRQQVVTLLSATQFTSIEEMPPRSAARVRLVGPEARQEAMRIAIDRKIHEMAIVDVDRRLPATRKFGLTIGRYVREKDACFTYYQTNPHSVDIVFRHHKAGRLLWYKLIKNKAHLVGGKRDVDALLKDKQCFSLKPDN